MTSLTVTELQLLEFFGVEPEKLDKTVDWPYTDFTYGVKLDDLSVSCTTNPACRDIGMVVTRGESIIYELSALAVDDIRLPIEKNQPLLEILIDDKALILL